MATCSAGPAQKGLTVQTPYYLIDKSRLQANMEKIARLRALSGARCLLALILRLETS